MRDYRRALLVLPLLASFFCGFFQRTKWPASFGVGHFVSLPSERTSSQRLPPGHDKHNLCSVFPYLPERKELYSHFAQLHFVIGPGSCAAVLCGLDTLGDLGEEFLAKELGIEKIPSKATFASILSMVDRKQIGEVIIDVLHSRFGSAGVIIAVDGKAICSTAKPGHPHSALQILSAYVTGSGIVLAQESIHEKTNEIPVFQEMLTYLDVEGKTVTADAMHCQRGNLPQNQSAQGGLSVWAERKSAFDVILAKDEICRQANFS